MLRDRNGNARAATTMVFVALLTLTAAPAARAGFEQVASLFASGAWEQARGQAADAGSGARPAEALLWRSRLATDTTSALDLLREGLTQRRLARQVRARLALETADLELGRGHPAEALAVLSPLLNEGNDLPGEVPLAAARALLALGRGPRARELLTTVRTADPAFARSQALLGDIAIGRGDGAQALRWYDAADQADSQLRRRTVAGRCRAMLLGGRVKEVETLAAQLEGLDPGSLALLEIRRALHDHQDVETTRLPTTLPPAGAASDESPNLRSADAANAPAGRYTLQLGAFGDRGRALEFQQRHADGVPGLTIEEGADARGQSLYRLRAGAWSSPDEAETAASELSDRLRLDVIVVDREATARPDR